MMCAADMGRIACETGGNGERVRCERVRDPPAARSRSKSFLTRRLADSYPAELVRAARLAWSSIR
jgi:hypothetical protein